MQRFVLDVDEFVADLNALKVRRSFDHDSLLFNIKMIKLLLPVHRIKGDQVSDGLLRLLRQLLDFINIDFGGSEDNIHITTDNILDNFQVHLQEGHPLLLAEHEPHEVLVVHFILGRALELPRYLIEYPVNCFT